MVPPRWMVFRIAARSSGTASAAMSPVYPRRIPATARLFASAVRTAARMQAFIPGASPPLVRMPIRFMAHPRLRALPRPGAAFPQAS